MENIKEKMDILITKKQQYDQLNTAIEEKTADFFKIIEKQKKQFDLGLLPAKIELSNITDELNELSKIKVSIRLGDLINELSLLSNIESDKIDVISNSNIFYPGKLNINQIKTLWQKDQYYTLIICSDKNLPYRNKNQKFCFAMDLSLNFDEVEYDGKSFLEHCTVIYDSDSITERIHTSLSINKNIEDLKLTFCLGDLVINNKLKNEKSWHPNDLFTQAVINCVQKQNELSSAKTLKI